MRQVLLSIICMVSFLASGQGIIIHEKNDGKTSYKSTDVERIEFTQSVTESTSSTYATKLELQEGLDTKADKTAMNNKADKDEITALQNQNYVLQYKVLALERALSSLNLVEPVSTIPMYEKITIDGMTYNLGISGAIDLGLSVRWATMNVGAAATADYGFYYAWGETDTKSAYDMVDYFDHPYEKYVSGKKTQLDSEDDVAHVRWGGEWRMPTKAEVEELIENCVWTWTTYGGHHGNIVIGGNGNAIFIPAAGYRDGSSYHNYNYSYGYYWSSSLCEDKESRAWFFGAHEGNERSMNNTISRRCGLSVRPICP